MDDQRITVNPAGRTAAICTPIVLKTTGVTRLIFKPTLVANKEDPNKPIKGEILFQRKNPSEEWGEEWVDEEVDSVMTLKSGSRFKVTLDCDATDILLRKLKVLEEFYETHGIPFEGRDLPPTPERPEARADVRQIVKQITDHNGVDVLVGGLEWLAKTDDPKRVLSHLERLKADDLQRISSLASLSRMKRAMDIWKANEENDSESFWQTTFTELKFLLSQLFSAPVYFMRGNAYIGGVGIDGSGGKYADVLMKTAKTGNVQIIELKTPKTKLQASETRTDIYGPASPLTAAVTQVSFYKQTLLTHLHNIPGAKFEAVEPQCIVIAGHRNEFEKDQKRLNSFELYRSNLRHASVITFDELFQKTKYLIDLIEGETVDDDDF